MNSEFLVLLKRKSESFTGNCLLNNQGFQRLRDCSWADHFITAAVGEIGLDYHYKFAPPALQQEVFRRQVRLARDESRPIVIHTREADDDTVQILREAALSDYRWSSIILGIVKSSPFQMGRSAS